MRVLPGRLFLQVAGAPSAVKGAVLAGCKPENLHMLNQSQCISMPKVSDIDAFAETIGAMSKLAVDQREQDETLTILYAVPFLANGRVPCRQIRGPSAKHAPVCEARVGLIAGRRCSSLAT